MNKKIIIPVVVIGIIAAVIIITVNNKPSVTEPTATNNNVSNQSAENIASVKEFTMTSFVEMVDGKPKPQYSIKEITVNKGDVVRIKITVTKGMHDFKLDEYGIYADTKELNKEYMVEFTADKAGEFVYYCTKPGHRANGHRGTLKVIE